MPYRKKGNQSIENAINMPTFSKIKVGSGNSVYERKVYRLKAAPTG
jgi:hypothetical protein